jgi:hypothetical protein
VFTWLVPLLPVPITPILTILSAPLFARADSDKALMPMVAMVPDFTKPLLDTFFILLNFRSVIVFCKIKQVNPSQAIP